MNAKILSSLLLMAVSKPAFAICEHELQRHENYKREATKWGNASILAIGAGSFFGPLGGLAGAGPGAVSYRYDRMAADAWRDYERCIERVEREAKARAEEARRAEAKRLEEERQREKEKLDDLGI